MEIKVETTKIPEVIKITSPSWDGVILKMPRDKYDEWKKSGEQFKTASIYALYAGHFDRVTYGNDLYIGQSGDIQQRMDQHCAEKKFWSIVLIFSSHEDWMNIAHTKNIECTFIEMARTANRFNIANGNNGACTHLGIDDQAKIREYVKPITQILKMIGVDIFEPNTDGVYIYEKKYASYGTLKSVIRILDPQSKTIEILSGSELFHVRPEEVENIQGVDIIERNKIRITETQTMHLGIDTFPQIYGHSISNWKSKTGVSLLKYLKAYEKNEQ